jgi:hypothetical protein
MVRFSWRLGRRETHYASTSPSSPANFCGEGSNIQTRPKISELSYSVRPSLSRYIQHPPLPPHCSNKLTCFDYY